MLVHFLLHPKGGVPARSSAPVHQTQPDLAMPAQPGGSLCPWHILRLVAEQSQGHPSSGTCMAGTRWVWCRVWHPAGKLVRGSEGPGPWAPRLPCALLPGSCCSGLSLAWRQPWCLNLSWAGSCCPPCLGGLALEVPSGCQSPAICKLPLLPKSSLCGYCSRPTPVSSFGFLSLLRGGPNPCPTPSPLQPAWGRGAAAGAPGRGTQAHSF